jgi:arsenate reductase
MAEGWARSLLATDLEALSAGTQAKGLDARAVAVMAEAGVNISEQESKPLTEFTDQAFDLVVTVCADAERNCPVFPGETPRIHRNFDDPPRLAEGARSEEEALVHYRRVRDEIRAFTASLPDLLEHIHA